MERRIADTTAPRVTLDERRTYRLWLLVTQVQRCLASFYVARFGRPANAWRVFSVIGDGVEISPSEVTRLTNLERDKITRIVDRLVAQGLMRRNQQSSDRRRVLLSLTAKGKRANAEMDAMRRAVETELLGALEPWERETLDRVLDKLQQRAQLMFEGQQAWRKFDPGGRPK